MLISVVSGTYNRLSLLKAMIQSVRKQMFRGLEYEFVIVDGGSTDDTLQWCYAQRDITLIEHGELRGAIPAFCDGARAASGQYVVMANDDILFHDYSLLYALVHLEENPNCGAVAFADNRYDRAKWQVMEHPYRLTDGTQISGAYAQVGMYRRWLGELAGWWGDNDALMSQARTYGGDDYLSSRIWEMGYTIDPVPGALIIDAIEDDRLRKVNNASGVQDSALYYRRFPGGAIFGELPPDNAIEHHEQLRVLYLPIFEPGQPYQYEQKRGLRDALARRGIVAEYDYVNRGQRGIDIHTELLEIAAAFEPHLLFTQIHAVDSFSADILRQLRQEHPSTVCVNWNGDYWPRVYLEPRYMELLKEVDLALTVNTNVNEEYAANGISCAYWQCASEEPQVPPRYSNTHDIVYMANNNCQERLDLVNLLLETGYNIGIYGSGWPQHITSGNTHYDFATSHEIVRNAKIIVGDNQYNDGSAFISNRIWETMYPGGFMLHQRVDGLQRATGLRNGMHYVVYEDLNDMIEKVHYYMQHEEERQTIAERGCDYVRRKHTFDARLDELFEVLLPAMVADDSLEPV